MESPCFLVASGLRILPCFAGFCRGKLLIFFVANVAYGTHNLLVPGSNPGGPSIRINHFREDFTESRGFDWAWLRLGFGRLRVEAVHSSANCGCKSVP